MLIRPAHGEYIGVTKTICVAFAGRYYYIVDHKGLDNGRNRSVRLPTLRDFAERGESSLCFGASVQYEPLRGNDPDVWVPITRVRHQLTSTLVFDAMSDPLIAAFEHWRL